MCGRKQHPVWLCYTRYASIKTNIKGKCKGCGEIIQGVIDRLEKHACCCRRLASLGLWGLNAIAASSISETQEPTAPLGVAVEHSAEPPRKKACIQSTLPVIQTAVNLRLLFEIIKFKKF